MSIHNAAIPQFGKPLRSPDYYTTTDSILAVLRPFSSLRTCANHLNSQGMTTPAGLQWTRVNVANYLRSRKTAALSA
jgi:hypothetical protein